MYKRFLSNINHHIIVLGVLFLALSIGLVSILIRQAIPSDPSEDPYPTAEPITVTEQKLEKFASDEEYQKYISEGQESGYGFGGFGSSRMFLEQSLVTDTTAIPGALNKAPEVGGGGGAGRVSQTNVQVKGIDEPDIVKTDGKHIYFSKENYFYREPIPLPAIDNEFEGEDTIGVPAPSYYQESLTSIINAFPPETMEKIGSIESQGELLFINNTLIVITHDSITAYDVSNPRLPVESWSMTFDDNTSYQSARLYGDQLYLITNTWAYDSSPCPMPLFTSNGLETVMPCTEIYHPVHQVPTDSTITISKINTKDGSVTDKTSFVGSSGTSVVYMSPQSIYVTYSYSADMLKYFFTFLDQEGADLVSEAVMNKLETLMSYDISSISKMTEFEQVWSKYLATLSEDERRRIENEFQNRLDGYMKKHQRELETTGIVKLDRNNLQILSTGSVPGHPLNQFSLDEYNGNLRIATTSQGNMRWSSEGSVNDVYVLNDQLNVLGSVTDLGLDERIYSARFIGDKGYLVTFRQTDPFYILDLSNPSNPQMTGQLKIPGFSSYLHPINDQYILGVGEENGQVKLAMFDVSDPYNPIEADKYMLDEYWSDIANTHHAFLQDEKHSVFFIPAGESGYIFRYDPNSGSMNLLKAISIDQAKRALFLDDYLYIVGEQEIVVLDETSWERVNEMRL